MGCTPTKNSGAMSKEHMVSHSVGDDFEKKYSLKHVIAPGMSYCHMPKVHILKYG